MLLQRLQDRSHHGNSLQVHGVRSSFFTFMRHSQRINCRCDDYDMCQECYDKKEHDKNHAILIIPFPAEADEEEEEGEEPSVHNGIVCNGCGMDPITGARFK
jgi:hypothetical protein